jgi:hypothetical protein
LILDFEPIFGLFEAINGFIKVFIVFFWVKSGLKIEILRKNYCPYFPAIIEVSILIYSVFDKKTNQIFFRELSQHNKIETISIHQMS